MSCRHQMGITCLIHPRGVMLSRVDRAFRLYPCRLACPLVSDTCQIAIAVTSNMSDASVMAMSSPSVMRPTGGSSTTMGPTHYINVSVDRRQAGIRYPCTRSLPTGLCPLEIVAAASVCVRWRPVLWRQPLHPRPQFPASMHVRSNGHEGRCQLHD